MFLLYGLTTCPYCTRAENIMKELKRKYKIPYQRHNMRNNQEKEYFKRKNKMQTFPQIFFIKGSGQVSFNLRKVERSVFANRQNQITLLICLP